MSKEIGVLTIIIRVSLSEGFIGIDRGSRLSKISNSSVATTRSSIAPQWYVSEGMTTALGGICRAPKTQRGLPVTFLNALKSSVAWKCWRGAPTRVTIQATAVVDRTTYPFIPRPGRPSSVATETSSGSSTTLSVTCPDRLFIRLGRCECVVYCTPDAIAP